MCCISLPRSSFMWRCSGCDVLQDLKVGEMIWRPKPVIVLFSLGQKIRDLSSLTGVQKQHTSGCPASLYRRFRITVSCFRRLEAQMFKSNRLLAFPISGVPFFVCHRYYQLTADVWIRSTCVGLEDTCHLLFDFRAKCCSIDGCFLAQMRASFGRINVKLIWP